MNVLSLCDGMSCGQIALERAGLVVHQYFASEIEKTSIQITQKNYPHTIQLGDMTQIDEACLSQLPPIDLIISGTPCRDFSRCTIQGGSENWTTMHSIGKGVYGKHSRLFFIFKEIYDYIKTYNNPNVKFLFENVVMKPHDEAIVSDVLGVQPIKINSSLFSAQNRERLYWTDIPLHPLPTEPSPLVLRDIVLDATDVPDKYWYHRSYEFRGEHRSVCAMLDLSGHDIQRRVTSLNFKSPTLTSCRGGHLQKKVYQEGKCRKLTPTEYERLQTVPEGYTEGVSDSQRYNMLGDGWTVEVIAHLFKGLSSSV